MKCDHALKTFNIDLFGNDIEQSNLISSIMVELNDRGHKTKLENV